MIKIECNRHKCSTRSYIDADQYVILKKAGEVQSSRKNPEGPEIRLCNQCLEEMQDFYDRNCKNDEGDRRNTITFSDEKGRLTERVLTYDHAYQFFIRLLIDQLPEGTH